MKNGDGKITELELQADKEMNIKNNLYAFLLENGMFLELREFELSHNVSSADCHSIDLLAEAQGNFEVEKNIKTNLYRFIINNGLYGKLKEYNRTHGFESPDSRIHKLAGITRDQFVKAKRSDQIVKFKIN